MPVERLVSEASHDPPSIPTRPSHGAPDSVGPILHPAVRLVSSQTRRQSRAASARLSRLDAVGGWASTKPPPICWVRVPIIRCTSAVFLLALVESVRGYEPPSPRRQWCMIHRLGQERHGALLVTVGLIIACRFKCSQMVRIPSSTSGCFQHVHI